MQFYLPYIQIDSIETLHIISDHIKYLKKLNLPNINFPCKTLDIKRFIKQNKNLNLCIYLFEARRNCNGSLQIFSDQKIGNGKQRIHLLSYTLYSNKKVKNKYYFWMKNINNTFRQEKKRFLCLICYNRFSSKHALNNHLIKCESNSKEVFPDPGTYIEYTDILSAQQSSEINIFGFADFESKLSPIKDQNECKNM